MSLWRGSINDDSLGLAWQELAAQAKDKPWLLKLLAERGAALATRYALWKGRLRRLRQGERRKLQRRLGVGLAGAALLLALSGGPAGAAPANMITVDGTCTLVDAIVAANTDAVVGSCGAGSGADTIDLQVDVSLTGADNVTYDRTGLPVVTSEITIEGNGNTISRDGIAATEHFRILAVGSGGNLTLNSATISGGAAFAGGGILVGPSAMLAMSNSTVSGNIAYYGGGIEAYGATVTVLTSTVSDNTAYLGAGILSAYSFLVVSYSSLTNNSGPSVTVQASSVTAEGAAGWRGPAGFRARRESGDAGAAGREARWRWSGGAGRAAPPEVAAPGAPSYSYYGAGGGLYNNGGVAAVIASTVSGNVSANAGGLANGYDGSMFVAFSTLRNNSGAIGGAIGQSGAYAVAFITHSTLTGNSANYGGGVGSVASGGVALINSTVTGNTARGVGGGVAMNENFGALIHLSSIVGNTADVGGGIYSTEGTVTLANATLPARPHRLAAFELDEGMKNLLAGAVPGRVMEMLASRPSGSLRPAPTAGSYLDLYGNLISGNTATGITLASGLVRPQAISYGNEVFLYGGGAFYNAYNLLGHDGETSVDAFYSFTPSAADVVVTSDGLTPVPLASIVSTTLADNDSPILAGAPPGAVVQTLAVPTGSPAIDAVDESVCYGSTFFAEFGLDERGKARNVDGNGSASDHDCDAGAYELQPATVAPRINVHKQTLPAGDPTEFLFRLRGPVGRDFTLADDEPHSTGQIPAGIYTLEEIIPPGWDPTIPLAQMTCDDGSLLNAIDLGPDEVLVCRFFNYKRGNIVVKKVTIPPVASPSFAMRLIDNTTQAKTQFSVANGGQFDTGAISSVPTYKLLEPAATIAGGWKKKSIACTNGSPATAIVVPPGGSVTCTVTNENSAPTNILLSSSAVAENKPAGTVVGTLSASDAIAGDAHSFSFVNDGTAGASGNGSFQIVGNQLKTTQVFDYETKTSYNIKLKATDTAGQTKIKNFIIQIVNKPG